MIFTHHFKYRGYHFVLVGVDLGDGTANIACRTYGTRDYCEEYGAVKADEWLLGVLMNIRKSAWDWAERRLGPEPIDKNIKVTLASIFEDLNAQC